MQCTGSTSSIWWSRLRGFCSIFQSASGCFLSAARRIWPSLNVQRQFGTWLSQLWWRQWLLWTQPSFAPKLSLANDLLRSAQQLCAALLGTVALRLSLEHSHRSLHVRNAAANSDRAQRILSARFVHGMFCGPLMSLSRPQQDLAAYSSPLKTCSQIFPQITSPPAHVFRAQRL